MLDMIVDWLLGAITVAADSALTTFLQALALPKEDIFAAFPILNTGYVIFQAIGIAITLGIASVQIFKYFLGPLVDSKETPIQIAVRAAISAMLIYFGNHAVMWLIDIARYPFLAMSALEAANPSMSTFSQGLSALDLAGALVIILIAVIAIVWNLIKLAIEICERYLMVFVLAFTSPLVFSTFTSKSTVGILGKWFSMFLSQCLLMTLSSWSLKLIISGLNSVGGTNIHFLVHLIYVLAMCKIAQRMDTYMQQIGLNAAHTGGNLLDDVLAVGKAMGNVVKSFGKDGGSSGGKSGGTEGGAPLGASGSREPLLVPSDFTGKGAGIANAARAFGRRVSGAAGQIVHDKYSQMVSGPTPYKGVNAALNTAKAAGKLFTLSGRTVLNGMSRMTTGRPMFQSSRKRAQRIAANPSKYNPDGSASTSFSKTSNAMKAASGSLGKSQNVGKLTKGVAGLEVADAEGDLFVRNPMHAEDVDKNGKEIGFEKAQKYNAAHASELNTIQSATGDKAAIAATVANSYNEAGLEGNEDLNETLINTVRNDPEIAQMVMDGADHELADNDALGSAILETLYGEEGVNALTEGNGLHDIRFGQDGSGSNVAMVGSAEKGDKLFRIENGMRDSRDAGFRDNVFGRQATSVNGGIANSTRIKKPLNLAETHSFNMHSASTSHAEAMANAQFAQNGDAERIRKEFGNTSTARAEKDATLKGYAEEYKNAETRIMQGKYTGLSEEQRNESVSRDLMAAYGVKMEHVGGYETINQDGRKGFRVQNYDTKQWHNFYSGQRTTRDAGDIATKAPQNPKEGANSESPAPQKDRASAGHADFPSSAGSPLAPDEADGVSKVVIHDEGHLNEAAQKLREGLSAEDMQKYKITETAQSDDGSYIDVTYDGGQTARHYYASSSTIDLIDSVHSGSWNADKQFQQDTYSHIREQYSDQLSKHLGTTEVNFKNVKPEKDEYGNKVFSAELYKKGRGDYVDENNQPVRFTFSADGSISPSVPVKFLKDQGQKPNTNRS